MSLKSNSSFYETYNDHYFKKKKAEGPLEKVFDIITDLSDRRGFKQIWEDLDGDVQDEIILKWHLIIRRPRTGRVLEI